MLLQHFETDDAKLWAVFWCALGTVLTTVALMIGGYQIAGQLRPENPLAEPLHYTLTIEPKK